MGARKGRTGRRVPAPPVKAAESARAPDATALAVAAAPAAAAAPRRIAAVLPRLFLACLALLFAALFTGAGLLIHGNLGTSAYDLGIFDQAFWRYSQLLDNFNTVRGLPILGDHFSPIAYLFAPLYRIQPDVLWPIALQCLSVALGGVALYGVALARLPGWPWAALAFALGYWLHPAVHSTLLWQYHELVLASGLYIGLIWCYLKQRWWPFVGMVVLLLSCREDMPFTLAAFGCLALIEKRWRYGIFTLVAAVLWWLMAVKWLMPLINGQGYFRHVHGTLGALFANIDNPQFYLARLADRQTLAYLWQVFFPFGFVALLSSRFLLPALPTLAANILIGGYNTQIGFHYTVSIMPFLFWGAIETVARRRPRFEAGRSAAPALRSGVVLLLLVGATGWAYSQYSALNVRRLADQRNAWLANAPKRDLLASIDREFAQQGIAASDFLLPHLAHRERIYLFPNPWQTHYWGIAGERPHHPNGVNAIVISRDLYGQYADLIDYLLDTGIFRRERDELGILLLKRIKAEAADRDQAVAALQNHVANSGLRFEQVALSPTFPTPEAEFRRVDIPVARLQARTPANWQALATAQTPLLNIDLTQGGSSDYSTRYVRAVVNVDADTPATLAIGSDYGVTAWLNGSPIHENIVLRPAHAWDDHVRVGLKRGANVLVFRVNNAGGAWRLLARVRPGQA